MFFASIQSFVDSARSAREESRDLHFVWRQVSLQHFDSEDCSFERAVSKRCSDRQCDYASSVRSLRDTEEL